LCKASGKSFVDPWRTNFNQNNQQATQPNKRANSKQDTSRNAITTEQPTNNVRHKKQNEVNEKGENQTCYSIDAQCWSNSQLANKGPNHQENKKKNKNDDIAHKTTTPQFTSKTGEKVRDCDNPTTHLLSTWKSNILVATRKVN
jgi:hypothetical protein